MQAAPTVAALLTLAAGVMLLVSGATPTDAERFGWLMSWAPLVLIEVSHFASSLVGLALVLIAFGLKRRLDAAWGDIRVTSGAYMQPKLNGKPYIASPGSTAAPPCMANPFATPQYGNPVGFTCTDNAGQFGFRSLHPGGGNFAFADGSVKFIKDSMNLSVYRALATRDMGEAISSDAL